MHHRTCSRAAALAIPSLNQRSDERQALTDTVAIIAEIPYLYSVVV